MCVNQDLLWHKMYEVSHISNLIGDINGDVKVIISLKKLEEILEELQELKKYKREKENNSKI